MMYEDAKAAVHTAAVAAGAVSTSPIPFSDAAILIPIQATMIIKIYSSYGESISEGVVKGILEATTATAVGKSLVGNLLKFIPGVGTVAGAVINGGVAVVLTEMIGNTLIDEFEGNGYIDLNELENIIKHAIKIAFD